MSGKFYPEKEDPKVVLIDALITGSSGAAIEMQEARGQAELVRSEVLPRKVNFGSQKQLEDIGIVFGEDADDMFVYVTLPEGWRKERTDHSMWSKLMDNKGRERASIFYKAAFYDRNSFITMSRRFGWSVVPTCGWDADYKEVEKSSWRAVVTDCGEEIWRSETILGPKPVEDVPRRAWDNAKDALGLEAEAWLEANFPDYRDPTAYWD